MGWRDFKISNHFKFKLNVACSLHWGIEILVENTSPQVSRKPSFGKERSL